MITVTILTKNSEKSLEETLTSLRLFPEVLIYDTGSQDNTLQIAKQFPNVKIVSAPFLGFGPTHNAASLAASFDWIFSVDSDEVVSTPLAQEILSLSLDPKIVYSVQRDNYFNGKKIKCCSGWYPDPVVRLYHRQTTRFTEDAVHERVQTKGLTLRHLRHPLKHTPYPTLSDFLRKMDTYSTLFAQQNKGKKQASVPWAVLKGLCAFFKSCILKRGILGGKEGFIISAYNGQTTYYKYLKLALVAPGEEK